MKINLFNKTGDRLFFKNFFIRVIIICQLIFLTSGAGDQDPIPAAKENHDLSITIGGINSNGTNQWFGDQSTISKGNKEKYIIVSKQSMLDMYTDKISGYSTGDGDRNFLNTHSGEAQMVPRENIIVFDPQSPESVKKIQEIGSRPNAAVFIDMDLSVTAVSPVRRVWDQETDWAAKAATIIAQSHKENTNDSKVTLFGHSAGTEALSKAQEIQQNKLNNNSIDGKLFDVSIAASPRDYKRFYDKETIMIIADGDFSETPGGYGVDRLKHGIANVGEKDAIELALKGYKVLRVQPDLTFNPVESHNIVHQLSQPGLKVRVYSVDMPAPVTLPGTTLSNVINKVSESTARITEEAVKNISDEIKLEMPSENLGGISLNATADIPANPADITDAGFDSEKNLLYLHMQGKKIFFPFMDPEVLRLCYNCVYVKGKKPELSIGASPFTETKEEDGKKITRTKENVAPPGMQSVYYLGETENTFLGLAMLQADQALGQLSFDASSEEIRTLSKTVPGFHSLPELFPAKYANHPLQSNYLGSQRIYLYSKNVELAFNKKERCFDIVKTGIQVQFEKEGPAESYFGKFLTDHFYEIANSPLGSGFKNLVPFVHAAAIFRWFKLNNIQVNSNELARLPVTKVFTPKFIRPSPATTLEKLSPSYPTIVFGSFGPDEIYFSASHFIKFSYKKGLPVHVTSYDGKSIDITRDAAGLPFTWKTNESIAGIFVPDQDMGPVVFNNVKLEGNGSTLSARITSQSVVYPENQPEAAVRRIISDFISTIK